MLCPLEVPGDACRALLFVRVELQGQVDRFLFGFRPGQGHGTLECVIVDVDLRHAHEPLRFCWPCTTVRQCYHIAVRRRDASARRPSSIPISGGRMDQIGGAKFAEPPLLVVEIRSPGTALIDLNRKTAAYERFGVPSYWIVIPDPPQPELPTYPAQRNCGSSSPTRSRRGAPSSTRTSARSPTTPATPAPLRSPAAPAPARRSPSCTAPPSSPNTPPRPSWSPPSPATWPKPSRPSSISSSVTPISAGTSRS